MSTFQSFEEINAWQESRILIRSIRSICIKSNVKRDFAFIDQITRASRSISANIAEGFESITTPEFITFLSYAKRSAGEVRSHLYDALDANYISKEEFEQLAEQTKRIVKMIAKLIHYLQTLNPHIRRTLKSLEASTKNQKLITSN